MHMHKLYEYSIINVMQEMDYLDSYIYIYDYDNGNATQEFPYWQPLI